MKRFVTTMVAALLGVSAFLGLTGFGGASGQDRGGQDRDVQDRVGQDRGVQDRGGRDRGVQDRGGQLSPEQAEKFVTVLVDGVLDDIRATDAQRATARSLKDNLLKESLGLREQQAVNGDELLKLWESASPDSTQVHALVEARVDALRQLAHDAANAALEMHQTLTPEQRGELAKKLREYKR